MSKAALGRSLAGLGVLLTLSLALLVFLRPDLVETRSHAPLASHVRSSIAQRTPHSRSSPQQADIQRALGNVCHYCSPRRPEFVPEDAPFEVRSAVRFYLGALLDLFVGILSFLLVNLLTVTCAVLVARSQPKAWPCASAVVAAVTLSEVGGLLAYLVAPSSFHFAVLRWPLNLAMAWGLALGIAGTACSVIRQSTGAASNPSG